MTGLIILIGLFLLSITYGNKNCYSYYDEGGIRYISYGGGYASSECKYSGSGWSLSGNTFMFKSGCCENSNQRTFIRMNEDGSSKYIRFDSSTNIKYLYLKTTNNKPTVPNYLYLQYYPNMIFIDIERPSYESSSDQSQETIYVYDRPAVIRAREYYSKLYLDYQYNSASNMKRPYLYIYLERDNPNTRDIYSEAPPDGTCAYAYNTDNIYNIKAPTDCQIKRIATIGTFSRVAVCRGTSQPASDSSCKLQTPGTFTIGMFDFNYPDCYYNSSLFTMTITGNPTKVTFPTDYATTWKGIVFSGQTQPLTLVVPSSKTVTITSSTFTFPSYNLTIQGTMSFKAVSMTKLLSGHHKVDQMSATSITFNGYATNDVLFLVKATTISGASTVKVVQCGGTYNRAIHSTSSIGCDCLYHSGKFDVEDCIGTTSDTRRLIIESGDYWESGVVWGEIVFDSDGQGIGGTVQAKTCSFSGTVKVYGTLTCTELIPSGELTIELDYSDSSSKGMLTIGTLQTTTYPITFIINEATNGLDKALLTIETLTVTKQVTIQGEVTELQKVQMTEGSMITSTKALTIGTVNTVTGVETSCTIQSDDKVTINNLISTNQVLDIVAPEVTFGSGTTVKLKSISIESPLHITSFVTEINVGTIITTLTTNIISVDQSTEELKVNIESISTPTRSSDMFIVMSLKDRQVDYSQSSSLLSPMCDRQILVSGTPDDSLCPTLGYGEKICVVKDGSGIYYDGLSTGMSLYDFSCPSHVSLDKNVKTTLILDHTVYTMKDDEKYDIIKVEIDSQITVSNQELAIELSSAMAINGNGNYIFITNTDGQQHLIDSTGTNTFIIDKENYGMGVYDNKIASGIVTTTGLCSSVYNDGTKYQCLTCRYGELNNECVSNEVSNLENCKQSSDDKCVYCNDGYYVNNNGECSQCGIDNCKVCESNAGQNVQCVLCEDNYMLNGNSCQEIPQCDFTTNDMCLHCSEGQLLDETRQSCQSTCIDDCNVCDDATTCQYCDIENIAYLSADDQTCVKDTNAVSTENDGAYQCQPGYYVSEMTGNRECEECSAYNCATCENNGDGVITCLTCVEDYLFNKDRQCVPKADLGCKTVVDSTCEECEDSTKVFMNGECQGCLEHCQVCTKQGECLECQEDYYMKVTRSITNSYNYECVENATLVTSHCEEFLKGECHKCESGYYLVEDDCPNYNDICRKCVPCSEGCVGCTSSTECYECSNNYILSDQKCETGTDTHCRQYFMDGSLKCAICEDRYYRDDTTCKQCMDNCVKCYEATKCIKCDNNYYVDPKTAKCKSTSLLENCEEFDTFGCSKCEEGFYVLDYECNACNSTTENCIKCNGNNGRCEQCENEYILEDDATCMSINNIQHCKSSDGIKCTKCSFWYEPDENDKQGKCQSAPVWWVIVLAVIAGVIIMILCLILLMFITFRILKCINRQVRMREMKKSVTVFGMNESNIVWIPLSQKRELYANKKEIDFQMNQGFDGETKALPVDVETRDIICIGNGSKGTMSLTFLTVDEIDSKYTIRCHPEQVTLKKGEACEVEVFITPLCSCHIDQQLKLIAYNVHKNEKTTVSIPMTSVTEMSTRLDPDELADDKKLGEGSFGIVFLGTYRGNKVAIKRLKNIEADMDDKTMAEFEKEVSMLDKFRCDYIIHFYGAVFIPNKICMVTEFAEHGSMQDLMKKRESNPIEEDLKIKLLLDCARGIQYLHDNGILHRDIKPDNFLVTSLDKNDKVNAKLTDFGASRNINLLMTNLTFTKGIGTPKYMAPEILKRDHYKMPADIYSFAVTILEIMIWDEAYPKDKFKFPWDIADLVTEGGRTPTIEHVENEHMKEIIEKCWCQEPSERLIIGKIIPLIEQELSRVN